MIQILFIILSYKYNDVKVEVKERGKDHGSQNDFEAHPRDAKRHSGTQKEAI